MKENDAKDDLSIRQLMGRVYRRFRSLSWGDRLRIAYFCMAFTMLVGRVENNHFAFLVGLAINLLYAYEQVRRNSIIEKLMLDNDIMEESMNGKDNELLRGLFEGAVLHEPQIVIAQSGSKVVYKEVTSSKEEKPQVTDIQIANAIRAINGKGKPLNGYQLWLGACCLLSWKYDFPRNLNECCERINALPLEGVEYICKYDNIRKLAATNKFVKEDARQWDSYKPKDDERNFFNGCLSVSQALDAEIQKQIELD